MPPLPPAPKPRSGILSLITIIAIIGIFVIGSFIVVGRAPADFVPGTIVTIPRGTTTGEAAELLAASHIIRSASVFEFIISTVYFGSPVIAGDFQFDEKLDVLGVAERMTGGTFGAAAAKITIPEGSTNADIIRIITTKIPSFNGDEFIAKAKSNEGFLFPATYLVFKSITPDEFIKKLSAEYDKRIAPLRESITASGHTEKQIITMASILEKEARDADEAKVISGILWKRLKNNQALQVDATIGYVTGKTSAQLTMTDLQKDGPYNTYTRRGLPAGPIGNPGIAMITAAIHPEDSPYNFYLHDKNGGIHYAKTYSEHLANKAKYLK